ncbi:MAG: flagellar hook-associated protein FlgK [Magnetovibrio sp.]|nr:flagellar hook-associated protein FlgK [Magnetovibrio sp.]
MGDITMALRSAQSGLLSNQEALNVVANNISNVNTEGYSRRIVSFKTVSISTGGGGVQIADVARAVDEGLLKTLRVENGQLHTHMSQETILARVQELFGAPGDDNSIAHLMEEFNESIELLAITPEKSLEAAEVVRRAQDVLNKLKDMSVTIQDLRLQADQDIANEVSHINTITAKIDQLNDSIIATASIGRDVSDLEDQRDLELDNLSKIVDIRYFHRSDGDVVVFTKGGRTLVDTVPPVVSHTAASSMTSTTTHAEGDIGGIYVGTKVDTNDMTNEIVEGKLKGFIDLRDSILPNLQAEIDELASELRDTFNQVHNRGTTFPGAQSYNGSRIFIRPSNQTMTLAADDDVKLVLFDSNGDQSKVTTLDTIMRSSSYGSGADTDGTWTISEVAATIEDWLQANGAENATTAISSDGTFDIALNTTSLNLAFRDETSSTNGSTHEDVVISYDANGDTVGDDSISGFSNFLGLNDFFVDTRTENMWESNIVSSDLAVPAATLTFYDATGSLGSLAVSASTSITDLATSITSNMTNITATVVPEGDGSRLRISHSSGSAITVTQGNGETLLTELGLHVSDAASASVMSIRSDIVSTPANIATGRVQWDSELGSAGEYFVSAGDDTNIQALASLMTTTNTFEKAGGLASKTQTFSVYAAEILATNASLVAVNERERQTQETLVESLQFKSDSARGVNLDQEMSDLLVFEQAYAAAARVISVIQNMIEALERAVS